MRNIAFLTLLAVCPPLAAQRDLSGAAQIKLRLDSLGTLGRLLMIAAHPDDENTAVLAYFARGQHMRTGYLSLTRGEGGQNLIGSEQGDGLGAIRTQELLAARRIDGAEQYFTRAIDFGFSKDAKETLTKWDREKVLSDVVWVIRKFRPDVVIFRFSGTPRDGHGHHQSSAILGKEAFDAAADPARFPEQLKVGVETWKPRRAFFNFFAFNAQQEKEAAAMKDRVELDVGDYSPLLGRSYGEIAGMSRSMHRSQAMGSSERKGSQRQFFTLVAGEPAKSALMEGIDTSWSRVGAEDVGVALREIAKSFEPDSPEKSIPRLAALRPRIAAMKNEWRDGKLRDLDEAIAQCAGLWLDLSARAYRAVPGGKVDLTATAVNRADVAAELRSVALEGLAGGDSKADALPKNQSVTRRFSAEVPANQPYTALYWLANPKDGALYGVRDQSLIGMAENPAFVRAKFSIAVGGQVIEIVRPAVHRYVDRVYGELERPLVVVPPVGVALREKSIIVTGAASRRVEVMLQSNSANASGTLKLEAGAGWKVEPESQPFDLKEAGEQRTLLFAVTPPIGESDTMLQAVAEVAGRRVTQGVDVIDYPHIPPQTLFPVASARLVRTGVKALVKSVGYVMGAGDDVPAALKQIGLDVTPLSPGDLARSDLSRFDAIVTGVRAWNTRADLRANHQRLLDYMTAGGTVVVQYNVQEGGFFGGDPKLLEKIGPYPLTTGRERVTVEEAPITFLNPASPLLHSPNEIASKDFDGWIQERGLYFASEWDPKYQALFACNDPGEEPMRGGTLATRYGKGAYVFTAYAWFRQLPAGVPGAFRIFANFLSAGKTLAAQP